MQVPWGVVLRGCFGWGVSLGRKLILIAGKQPLLSTHLQVDGFHSALARGFGTLQCLGFHLCWQAPGSPALQPGV